MGRALRRKSQLSEKRAQAQPPQFLGKSPLCQPVLPQDVSSVARALLAVPARERSNLCQTLFDRADMAAVHVARTGTLHPIWGNGSLDAAARHSMGRLYQEPLWSDVSYINCLRIVLAVLDRRFTRPEGAAGADVR